MGDGRDVDAAAVADRLKAFAEDPSRSRHRFLSGLEPLPAGGPVLRFAQGRFPAGLRLGSGPERELRAAAEQFVRHVCLADGTDHYQVLCARPDAPYEAIKENYHLLMALLHPDRQERASDRWPEACAQRVNLAYATLGDEAMRREYDALIRAARPAARARMGQGSARARMNEVRFAKTLIVVSAVVAALLAVALLVDDAEYRDRSVLQASLARLGANRVPGSERPRYVGATAMAQPQRASDASAAEDPEPFSFLKPIMRVLVPPAPTPVMPVPPLERIPAAPEQPVAALRTTVSASPMQVSQAASASTPTAARTTASVSPIQVALAA
jgi:hypothetical protein